MFAEQNRVKTKNKKIKQTSSAAAFRDLAGGSSGFCGGGGGGGGLFKTAATWAAWRFWSAGTWTSPSAILTKPLRKVDRMALFIPSHLLLYVKGETAEIYRGNIVYNTPIREDSWKTACTSAANLNQNLSKYIAVAEESCPFLIRVKNNIYVFRRTAELKCTFVRS